MDEESETVYLQNLEEFLCDESKVVTCRWLSATLSLHVNTARQLVHKFLQKDKVKKHIEDYKKTYYLSGVREKDNTHVSTILKEEDVPTFKATLSVVFSEQLYSIQKDGMLKDLSLLYVASKHEDSSKGAIKNDSTTKRPADELCKLRHLNYPKSTIKAPPAINNMKQTTKSSNTLFSHSSKESQIKKDVADSLIKSKAKEVFAQKNPSAQKSKVELNGKLTKKNAGIAGFFSKQTSAKPKVDNVKQEKKSPIKFVEKCEIKSESHSINKNAVVPVKSNIKKEKSSPVETTDKSEKMKTPELKQPSKSNRSNSFNGTKKKGTVAKKDTGKKRKRIQTVESDSEEESKEVDVDDIFSPDSPERVEKPQLSDDEDIIPPTPEATKAPLNPRKRKKMVDKTFMDENGYIVTKKEEVFESCSDEDRDDHKTENVPISNVKIEHKEPAKKVVSSPTKEPAKKVVSSSTKEPAKKVVNSPTKEPAKKVSSPTKGKKKAQSQSHGKQQSLTSFFKKIE